MAWPELDGLMSLPVAYEEDPEEQWQKRFTAWAGDGTEVVVTWDEMFGDASIRVVHDEQKIAALFNERVSDLRVDRSAKGIGVRLVTERAGVRSELWVDVGDDVTLDVRVSVDAEV